jgi:hypothetical protein|tara:strand:+ start:89 stop:514 length:426 start_codon:yes stop_codon:yes gene_type:complete
MNIRQRRGFLTLNLDGLDENNRYSMETYKKRVPLGVMQDPSNMPDQASVLESRKVKEAMVHKKEKMKSRQKLKEILIKDRKDIIGKVKGINKIKKLTTSKEELEVYNGLITQLEKQFSSYSITINRINDMQSRERTFNFGS